MTQIVLNIEDTSLLPSLKQILAAIKGVTIDKLIVPDTEVEAEKEFISNTIQTGYQQAKKGQFAGEGLSSLDSLVAELRETA